MERRSVDKLTVLEINGDELYVKVERIKEVLWQKTSEIVYCTKNHQLYGVVSIGDLIRGHENSLIKINTNYTSLSGWNAIKGKKIFAERHNIHKIPVVDKDGYLLGDYSRWDDLKFLRRNAYKDLVVTMSNLKEYADYCNVLIYPGSSNIEKLEIYEQMREALDAGNIQYVETSKSEVLLYINQKSIILFVDMDELKGTWGISGQMLDSKAAKIWTYQCFFQKLINKRINMINEMAALEVLMQLSRGGVKCYTISCRENVNGYLGEYTAKQKERLKMVPKEKWSEIREEIASDFLGELYTEEYWKEIISMPFAMQSNNGVNRLKNVVSRYLNVEDGERKTYYQPKQFDKTIYFFGPCTIMGRFVEDRYTIESFLQQSLNKKGYLCKVVNYGCWNDGVIDCGRIMETRFRKGDIVIVHSYGKVYEGIEDINMVEVAEKNQMPIEWTTDQLVHCNHSANKMYADYILDMIEKNIKLPVLCEQNYIMADKKRYIKRIYLDRYFGQFNAQRYKKIGSIVMNCNPFTLGHRYLIEKACEKVDFLILFVVQEDKSIFNFEERFAMVSEGTKDLEHIMIVPSGSFILSQTTFPEYFIKIADEDIIRNVDYDITVFAECIADQLNICCRFVGEEPNDLVTNSYNDAMKRILPYNDIELIEIKRKNNANVCISASLVRKYLEDDEIEKAWELVPETTKAFL